MTNEGFRWQAWWQRSADPVFLLNSQRRMVFANRAWENLTGLTLNQTRPLVCRRKRRIVSTDDWPTLLEYLLRPPDQVLAGQPARVQHRVPRVPPDRSWWEIEFVPFRGEQGLLFILGRIGVTSLASPSQPTPLPEEIQALREKVLHRYGLETLASTVPALNLVSEQVRLAARVGVPVLLTGEPGVGKNWVARTIHALGANRSRPFVALNCRRLPAEVVTGVLFGEGPLASQVEAGSVYLEEPSHLPRELQGRICDLLISEEDREQATRNPTGLRILAGLSSDPAGEVRSGRLLEEFLCFLSPLWIRLPPLRERRQDFPAWGERLLEMAREEAGSHFQGCTPAAWEVLAAYSWPGNLAELFRVLFSAGVNAPGPLIDQGDLPLYLRLPTSAGREELQGLPLRSLLEEVERRLIALALHKTGGNKSRASEILAINRPALLRRMEALGLTQAKGRGMRGEG